MFLPALCTNMNALGPIGSGTSPQLIARRLARASKRGSPRITRNATLREKLVIPSVWTSKCFRATGNYPVYCLVSFVPGEPRFKTNMATPCNERMANETEIQSDYSYSDDTFDSVPDEHPVYLYRSGRRESICLAESSVSSESLSTINVLSVASDDALSACETVNEVTEYSTEFDSEESNSKTESTAEFVKKKLEVLNSRKSNDGESATEYDNVDSKSKQPEKPLCLETLAFCDKKIQQLQGHSSGSSNSPWPIHHHTKAERCDEKRVNVVWHGNTAKIESLKIENLLSKMAKGTSVSQHNPRNCTSCRKQRSKLAEVDFLKRKLAVLKKPVFEARLENHLYRRDAATLLAEIINSGPKPSDPPGEIWDRLLEQQTNK